MTNGRRWSAVAAMVACSAVTCCLSSMVGAQPSVTPDKAFGARTYNVCDCGAVADGNSLNTQPIQKAIDACAAEKGGIVLVPAGDFMTGTIELKSNVTLHLAAGARLLGSRNREDYLNRDIMQGRGVPPGNGNVVLLFAANAKNVTIEGNGTIDGQGAAFYTGTGDGSAPGASRNRDPNAPQPNRDRPHLMVFHHCDNLKMRDVFLTASAYHCVRILQCTHVNFDGIRIYNRVNKNNDGFHFNNCRYVKVSNCEILCQDDACALFGSNQFVTVANCTFSTRWSIFRFGGGEAQNIAVSNCLIYETYGCPIKISAGGSRIENLSFSNIIMRDVTGPIGIGFGGGRPRGGDDAPASDSFVRNLSFNNIRATVVPTPVKHPDMPFDVKVYDGEQNSCLTLNAFGNAWLENISFDDVHITYAGGGTAGLAAKRDVPQRASEYFGVWGDAPFGPPAYGMYARNVRGLRMQNVRLDYDKADVRPAMIFDNVQDASIGGLSVEGNENAETALRFINSGDIYLDAPRLLAPVPVFLQVEGARCERITIDGGDLSRAGKAVAFLRDATAQMVKLRE